MAPSTTRMLHLLTIFGKHGDLPSLHVDEGAVTRELVEWVDTYWDELPDQPERPESDDEAVSLYFDEHPHESYSVTKLADPNPAPATPQGRRLS